MPEINTENFDAALRQHLAAELDPHRGVAQAAFLRHVNGATAITDPAEAPDRGGAQLRFHPRPARGTPNLWRGWTFTLASAALAASIVAVWAGPMLMQGLQGRNGGTGVPTPTTPVKSNPNPWPDRSPPRPLDPGSVPAAPNHFVPVIPSTKTPMLRYV